VEFWKGAYGRGSDNLLMRRYCRMGECRREDGTGRGWRKVQQELPRTGTEIRSRLGEDSGELVDLMDCVTWETGFEMTPRDLKYGGLVARG